MTAIASVKDLKAEALLKQFIKSVRVLAGTPRIVAIVWHAQPLYTGLLIGATICLGFFPVLELWLGKMIIDTLALALRSHVTPNFSYLVSLIVGIGGIRLAIGLLESGVKTLQEHIGEFVTREVNLLILNKTNSFKDMSLLEQPEFHDKLRRAQNEASYRPSSVMTNTMLVVRGLSTLFSMIAILSTCHPLLALAIMALSLPALIAQFRMDYESYSIQNHEIPEVRRMHYFSSVLTSIHEAKEVRLFNLGEFFLSKYLEKFDEFQARHQALRNRRFFVNGLLSGLSALGQVLAYSFIIYRAATAAISLGSLSLYLSAVGQLEASMHQMIYSVTALYSGNLFLNNLFEFLETEPTLRLSVLGDAVPGPEKITLAITFENVSFKYPGSDRMILDDVSFTLLPNQSVALVGENGAGKSTLVKLLSRFYDPTGGRILVDNIDLRDFDVDSWRTKLSVVCQDYARFYMTAADNIGIGLVEQIGNRQAIEAASDKASAAAILERLPKGYDSMLGRYFMDDERGADLSGGEWQKIALARAFMRSESAELLVLDEPTSALDAQAEYDVYLRFHELTRDKVTVLISHRFSTVKMADVVLVLENGKIVERGSHEELMEQSGTYARLYNLQADRYK